MAEDRRILEALVGTGHDPEVAEYGGEDDGAGPLGTVGDLERDTATVGEADGVDAFGAVLGDEPVGSADEGGDVPARTAQVLRVRADGGGDLRLGGSRARRSPIRPKARARPVSEMATTGAPQPSTAVAATGSPARSAIVSAMRRWSGWSSSR